MAMQVCAGATLLCSFGAAPSSLVVLPVNRVMTGVPAANITDHVPLLNIVTFGMCSFSQTLQWQPRQPPLSECLRRCRVFLLLQHHGCQARQLS